MNPRLTMQCRDILDSECLRRSNNLNLSSFGNVVGVLCKALPKFCSSVPYLYLKI